MRVRASGTWNAGTVVASEEFEALDEGQHNALKQGAGAVYLMTTDPMVITGTGLQVDGDGLGLIDSDGPYYAGGMAGAPLKVPVWTDPAWYIPLASQGSDVWSGDSQGMSQILNTADVYASCVLHVSKWHKQRLRRIRTRVKGKTGHVTGTFAGMKKPRFYLQVCDMLGADITAMFPSPLTLTAYPDTSIDPTAYAEIHYIDTGEDAIDILIDKSRYNYNLLVEGESGTGSLSNPDFVFLGVELTFDVRTIPFG